MVVCKKAYHKKYYAKNREQILIQQKRYRAENAEILKSRHKRWYENNREIRLASSQRAYCQQNKEHIRNQQRQYFKNNRERIKEYWRSYYAKNKEQIKQRLRDQKQRNVGQNIVHIGAWDQESEKLETSLVPSDTLCETLTVKTQSSNHFSLWSSCCYYSINVINYASDSLFITISWHRYTPYPPSSHWFLAT